MESRNGSEKRSCFCPQLFFSSNDQILQLLGHKAEGNHAFELESVSIRPKALSCDSQFYVFDKALITINKKWQAGSKIT